MSVEDVCFPELIGKTLAARNPEEIECDLGCFRHSAVLIPLFNYRGECRVLFTKRSVNVEHHKSQISFPGGAVDACDRVFEETALRETWEEIGLRAEEVCILGRLDDIATVASNFLIHPYVGLIPYPYSFVLSQEEVEHLVTMPLRVFLPGENASRGSRFEYMGETFHGPTFTFDGEVIWGATARIMDKLTSLLAEIIPLLQEGK
jgi:8-oxo-dGTP pyrophosphatase MutT (NUDIX family)